MELVGQVGWEGQVGLVGPWSEASGVPAKGALLGFRTEETPLEDYVSNPYCWWLVGYPGPISGYSPNLWQ